MHRPICYLVLLLAIATPTAPRAEQGADFKGVELKGKAPVSNDVLKVKFPKPAESKLKNGLALLTLEDHRSPTIQVQITMPASSLNDQAGVPISAATTALMRLGTKTKDARQIAETLAELGTSISFGIGDRNATATFSTLTENLDAVLALMSDMLFNSTFPQDELDKWKNQQLAQLQQIRAQPAFLVQERFFQAMYPNDRRSFVAPSVEGVRSITRDMVAEHYTRIFRPEGGWVTVLGDTNARQITPKLEQLLGDWKGAAPAPPALAKMAQATSRKVILVDRPNSVQTMFFVGDHAIDRRDPDYIPVQVLNRVLGGGPASRLFRNIREEKGYTYGISSSFGATHYYDYFATQTSVRTEVTGETLTEILKEFADVRDRPVPATELDGAKRALVATFALSTESPATALSLATQVREYGFPADYWDTYPEKIAAVTAADVQRVARKYIPVDNLQIVAVGDATKVRDILTKFGPLEEWDAEGRKVR
jgi:zinc protease